jgi:F-type H+-transporting ATPase subunit a
MEEQANWLTRTINHYLGPLALALLNKLHLHVENAAMPIPQHVAMGLLVLMVATLLALIVKSRLSVEKPSATQQVAELLLTNPLGFGIQDILRENVPHGFEKHIPVVGSVSIYVLLANLFGVFPMFSSPTGNATVPFACAILTFLYFNWQGLRHHGVFGYLKTFAGSPHKPADWALALLLFPVELISTTARLLSLTVRLWANIFASDMIYGLFLSIFVTASVAGWNKSPVLGVVLGVLPALIPIAFIGLHIFVSLIQTYVFTVLPSVYIGMATANEH